MKVRDAVNPQSHLVPAVIKERRRMNSSWRKVGSFQSENIYWNSFSGAHGVCHPGRGDGCLPYLLASFLSLVGAYHIGGDDDNALYLSFLSFLW